MLYTKLPLVIQDYGLGLQTINQANDNNRGLKLLYAEKHGDVLGPAAPNPWKQRGAHNDVLVCRTAARVQQITIIISATPTIVASGPGFASAAARVSTGIYFFPLQLENVWAIVNAEQDDSTPVRLTKWRYLSPSNSYSQQRGVVVETYELDTGSGTFALAEYDFQLNVWGTPAT